MLEIRRLNYIKCECCDNAATIQIKNDVRTYYLCDNCEERMVGKAAIILALTNLNNN